MSSNRLRPPVPLFPNNSTGHLLATMGAGEYYSSHAILPSLTPPSDINVAYDGTFGDLGAEGDVGFFNYDVAANSFDFELMPESYSSFDSATNAPGTVSPKDLYNDSVPPSTSFTNLTTPGSTFLDTPLDDYEASPLFDSMTSDNNNQWFSLFPDADAPPAPMERTSSSSHILVHPGGEGNARKRSSAQTSPTFSPVVKHSEVAGVAARKRDKPLPPIMVDEADPVALKRARNTAAARKSRAKKVMEKDDLEGQINELRTQVEYWKAKALAHGAADEE